MLVTMTILSKVLMLLKNMHEELKLKRNWIETLFVPFYNINFASKVFDR